MHGLDDRVLGRSVPDDRPLAHRLMHPTPAVWSPRGRLSLGLVIIGLLGATRLGDVAVAIAVPVLFGVALLAIFADERERSRRHHEHRPE